MYLKNTYVYVLLNLYLQMNLSSRNILLTSTNLINDLTNIISHYVGEKKYMLYEDYGEYSDRVYNILGIYNNLDNAIIELLRCFITYSLHYDYEIGDNHNKYDYHNKYDKTKTWILCGINSIKERETYGLNNGIYIREIEMDVNIKNQVTDIISFEHTKGKLLINNFIAENNNDGTATYYNDNKEKIIINAEYNDLPLLRWSESYNKIVKSNDPFKELKTDNDDFLKRNNSKSFAIPELKYKFR